METRATASRPLSYYRAALARFRERPGVLGAMLVSRDGIPIVTSCPSVGEPDVFGAMHATALGAAELALSAYTITSRVSLVAEVGDHRFVSCAVSEAALAIAHVDSDTDCEAVFGWMGEMARDLAAPYR